MAFEGLTEKLSAAFKKLRGKGRLSEADVKEAMREIRLALLEADVSYKVVKDFIKKTTERAVGADVLESANQPGDLQFLCTDSGTSRANRITHVAMVADAKNIVHARGKAYGVCVNRISHYAGKVCAVARFNPEGTLRTGMKGWRTLALQQKLNTLGASLETDGEYGNTTAGAVKAFQHARNLPTTGEADLATLEALGLVSTDSESEAKNVVRIIGDTVNVRCGPGTNYESIAIAHKGDTFPAVAAADWQPVLLSGEIRWVSKKYANLELAK